jgi:hypothetical protein|tara:strand:+ start:505 stop:795 length:291 start_codon:yes stop_codon:yes gene_type:complete
MYGTIFNLDVKDGHKESLLNIMQQNDRVPEGMVAWFLMNPSDEGKDLIGVAVFENKESHLANAENPDQHDYFVEMMKHLNSEPTWTDGEYVIGEIS